MKVAKQVARYALVSSIIAIGMGYASAFLAGGAPGWAPWLLALGIPVASVAIMVMGAVREGGKLGSLVIPFVMVLVLLASGFCLALALPATESSESRLVLGLPLRAAIIIYGVGLIPVVVLPFAYALTFETQTLSREDVERVRQLGAAYRKKS